MAVDYISNFEILGYYYVIYHGMFLVWLDNSINNLLPGSTNITWTNVDLPTMKVPGSTNITWTNVDLPTMRVNDWVIWGQFYKRYINCELLKWA